MLKSLPVPNPHPSSPYRLGDNNKCLRDDWNSKTASFRSLLLPASTRISAIHTARISPTLAAFESHLVGFEVFDGPGDTRCRGLTSGEFRLRGNLLSRCSAYPPFAGRLLLRHRTNAAGGASGGSDELSHTWQQHFGLDRGRDWLDGLNINGVPYTICGCDSAAILRRTTLRERPLLISGCLYRPPNPETGGCSAREPEWLYFDRGRLRPERCSRAGPGLDSLFEVQAVARRPSGKLSPERDWKDIARQIHQAPDAGEGRGVEQMQD